MANSNKNKPWKKFRKEQLSGGDMALFLCSFSAIFGILCNNPGGSIYYLVMFGLFAGFWLVMAFAGGQRLVKGMWITALVIWGMALAYCALNWYIVVPLGNPESVGQFLSAVLWILSVPATALLNPVFPLLYRLGYTASGVPAENAVFLILLCLGCMAVIAAAFAFGFIWARSREKKKAVSVDRKLETPMEFKD